MTTNLNTFTGEFSYTVDTKGRVNIPAKFRKALSADNEDTFIITRGMDPCVWAVSYTHLTLPTTPYV